MYWGGGGGLGMLKGERNPVFCSVQFVAKSDFEYTSNLCICCSFYEIEYINTKKYILF